MLKEVFASFYKNQLDWDRIVKQNMNDEKLLEEFKKEVIEVGNRVYRGRRTEEKREK